MPIPPSFFSDAADGADKIYKLIKTINRDYQNYKLRRDKQKIKELLIEMKKIIGKIDFYFTDLELKIDKLANKNQITEYQNSIEEFRKLYESTYEFPYLVLYGEIIEYFDDYPDLRELIMKKIDIEAAYPQKSDMEQEAYYKDFETFQRYVKSAKRLTRDTLNTLNSHLKTEF